MKSSIIALFSMLFVQTAFAAPEIAACSSKQLTYLNESIQEHKKDGFSNVMLFKNSDKQTVGFYAWNSDEDQMHAEVCEYVEETEMTVASVWYYWENENGSTNPNSFKKNKSFFLTQDEGLAKVKILEASKKGGLKLELTILGWDGDGNEVIARKSVLSLE